MNIGIDARVLIEKKTGMGYFLENILENILKNDNNNNYYLISDRKIFFDIKNYKNVHLVQYKDGKILRKTIGYYFRLGHKLNKLGISLDVFWATQHIMPRDLGKNVFKVLTMHDLVLYEAPKTTTFYNLCISYLFIPSSIRNSDRIVADSKSTLIGIKQHFSKIMRNKKIDVIYLGANWINGDKVQADFDKRYNELKFVKNNNYLLYVGTIEPRKNLNLLLKAYEEVRNEINIKLVLCGKIGWKYEDVLKNINNHKYKDDIYYINYITNEDKFMFMKNAFAFVFPSFYEGFGLPVVEAMKMGTVALVANNSSLNELIEKEELKFSAFDDNELASKIISLYKDKILYNECKIYCSERVEFFKWEKTSLEYFKVFCEKNTK